MTTRRRRARTIGAGCALALAGMALVPGAARAGFTSGPQEGAELRWQTGSAPAVPASVTGAGFDVAARTLRVTWQASDDATGYRVRATGSDGSDREFTTTVPALDLPATPGVRYELEVFADDGFESGPGTAASTARDAPDTVTAQATGPTTATVTWQSTLTGVASWRVQVARDPAFTTAVQTRTVTGTATSTEVTGLTPGADYWARVQAVTADGATASWSGVARTVTPLQVFTVALPDSWDRQVTADPARGLVWMADASNPEHGWDGTVTRLDTVTGQVTTAHGLPGANGLLPIAATGQLWVSSGAPVDQERIWVLDPSGAVTQTLNPQASHYRTYGIVRDAASGTILLGAQDAQNQGRVGLLELTNGGASAVFHDGGPWWGGHETVVLSGDGHTALVTGGQAAYLYDTTTWAKTAVPVGTTDSATWVPAGNGWPAAGFLIADSAGHRLLLVDQSGQVAGTWPMPDPDLTGIQYDPTTHGIYAAAGTTLYRLAAGDPGTVTASVTVPAGVARIALADPAGIWGVNAQEQSPATITTIPRI